ncbi:MAG: ParB/RepB/Spo0J family partition protein [Oscillospiraceae bacterium]|jgi:ParB family chromosome partitioning protein|nr:ParB/RepB/Spo0J family partition protein [Oscillospiraceae bacterium]
MAAKKGGLGRGLDSLFMDNDLDQAAAASGVTELRLSDVEPNANQPRTDFDPQALAELAASIKEQGVLQPILVRPLPEGMYQIIAGERRWRAARQAGLYAIPAIIKEMTDAQVMLAALVENLQREDLNPVEEAKGMRLLLDSLDITQEEAADRLGKSRAAVTNALRLLKLPEAVLEAVRTGELSGGHARALLSLEQAAEMESIAAIVIRDGLSVRDTEKYVKDFKKVPKPAQRKRVNPYAAIEHQLTEGLGRKVTVTAKPNGAGTLSLAFDSKEDLERVGKALAALD